MYNLRTRKYINYNKNKRSNYKVYVFDLDNTLFLHNSEEMYTQQYHKKVKNYLLNLKRDNKKICLATHNKNPKYYIEKMGLDYDFFDVIVYELKNVHPLFNSITEYTSKKDMILEIIKKTGCKKSQVLFFDDSYYNIHQVRSINVKSVKVSPTIGIYL
jgi:HAD superfamily phosphatase (TIGR01681 family)